MTLKIMFVCLMVTLLIELKWLISEHVFDRKGNDTALEVAVDFSQRVISHGTRNAYMLVNKLRGTEIWN